MSYDSKQDTLNHINEVALRLYNVMELLHERASLHDQSKLGPEEKPHFDAVTDKLKGLTYGSDEYREALKTIAPALKHHYANNSHHPEHYTDGIEGMDLIDLVEMYCDWAAAVTRHADGNLAKSIAHNEIRFVMSSQLAMIFQNTHARFGGFCGSLEGDPRFEPGVNRPMTLNGKLA